MDKTEHIEAIKIVKDMLNKKEIERAKPKPEQHKKITWQDVKELIKCLKSLIYSRVVRKK